MVAYDAAAIDCVQTVLSSAHDADGLASQHAVTALISFGVLPSSSGGGVDPATIGRSAACVVQGLAERAWQQYRIVAGRGIIAGDGLVAVAIRSGQRVPGLRVRRQ